MDGMQKVRLAENNTALRLPQVSHDDQTQTGDVT